MIPVLIELRKRVEALEAEVDALLGRAERDAGPRWLSKAGQPVKGVVVGNGGGFFTVSVDRATDDYPGVGSTVVAWEVEGEIPKPTSEWEGVIGFAKYNGAGETLFNQGGNARLNRELVDDGWTPLQARPEA